MPFHSAILMYRGYTMPILHMTCDGLILAVLRCRYWLRIIDVVINVIDFDTGAYVMLPKLSQWHKVNATVNFIFTPYSKLGFQPVMSYSQWLRGGNHIVRTSSLKSGQDIAKYFAFYDMK